ncbi:MAG: nuclear transport factor 2 family protein [Saprospiraceae bacterium]|nr:nuclear transport factor 2 family protein [Saprospiraceae bacterium]
MTSYLQLCSIVTLITCFSFSLHASCITLESVPTPNLVVSEDGNEVLMAEKSRFKAMVDRDLVTLDQVISEDLVYIHSNGSIDTKESYIAAIEDGSRAYNDITMKDAQVRTYGEVGIINAKCTYHRTTPEGRADNLSLFYTSVYAKIDGRWQHVSWQSFKMTE